MFRPLTPRSRWSEFFSNCAALMGIGRGPEIPLKSRPSDACYTDLPKGHYPGRGLLYSFLAHEIAIFAMLTVATATQLSREYRRAQEIWKAPEKRLTYLLPELGGGSSGEEPAPAIPATKSVGAQGLAPLPEEPAAPAAPAKPGLVYPAPQPIVSNPPNPTNRIQTILQPELVNPPTLQVPLALPNMVTIARAREPRPVFAPKVTAPPPAPAQTPSAPTLGPESHPLGWHFVNVQPMAPLPTPPQLSLPETSSNKFTPLPQNPATQVPNVAKAPAPATPEAGALKPEVAENVAPALPGNRERVDTAPKVSPSVPPSGAPASPEAAALKPEIGGGTDAHSVLVLSPTPGAPAPNLTILPGEARGHFAMGPEPNLNAPPGAGVGLGVAGGTGTASAGSATPESGATPATAGGTGAAQSAASRDLENRNLAPLTQGKGSGSLGGTGTSPGTGTGTTEGKGTGTGGDVSTGTALATGAAGLP